MMGVLLETLISKKEGMLIGFDLDHFNAETCKQLIALGNCLFIIPKSCVSKAVEIGIPVERMKVVEPGNRLLQQGIKIECIRAIHGHIGQAVYSGANMLDCGYRLEMGGTTRQ